MQVFVICDLRQVQVFVVHELVQGFPLCQDSCHL